jgi:arsenite methyltransferase
MNTLSFAGDMARLQRAIAESHDLVVRRAIVLETLNLRAGERVLELGCGGGYYTREAARFVGPTGRVCAIDISPDQVAAAQARCAELGRMPQGGYCSAAVRERRVRYGFCRSGA